MSEAQANRIDLDQLEAKLYDEVDVAEWNRTVRLKKLPTNETLELIDLQRDFDRDDEGFFVNQDEACVFAVELAARSIVEGDDERPFDNARGRELLERADFETHTAILKKALPLNGFQRAQAAIRDAKKKSPAGTNKSPSTIASPSDARTPTLSSTRGTPIT